MTDDEQEVIPPQLRLVVQTAACGGFSVWDGDEQLVCCSTSDDLGHWFATNLYHYNPKQAPEVRGIAMPSFLEAWKTGTRKLITGKAG